MLAAKMWPLSAMEPFDAIPSGMTREQFFLLLLLAIYFRVIIAGTGILLLLPGAIQRLQQCSMRKMLECFPAALQSIGSDFAKCCKGLGFTAVSAPFLAAEGLHAAVSKCPCLIIVVWDVVVVLPVVLALLPLAVVSAVILVVGNAVLVLASLTCRAISFCARVGLVGLSNLCVGTRRRKVLTSHHYRVLSQLCLSMASLGSGQLSRESGECCAVLTERPISPTAGCHRCCNLALRQKVRRWGPLRRPPFPPCCHFFLSRTTPKRTDVKHVQRPWGLGLVTQPILTNRARQAEDQLELKIVGCCP